MCLHKSRCFSALAGRQGVSSSERIHTVPCRAETGPGGSQPRCCPVCPVKTGVSWPIPFLFIAYSMN
ncbi:hypothetical protein DAQ1742_02688 [Dickeya aquatica]|uniref:Uncharacterized protein n=1 Tax=Dickeya aquatica TaxID=1401087 RepID=A0A375AD76_9GAMM|nr:hypothetical protein DAQ1742_02688 [Dickeya aquatica]